MKKVIPLVSVFVIIFTSACALTSFLSKDGGGTGKATDSLFTDKANPINVTVSLEDQNAQTAVISPDGGQLTATDAAGNRFTLDIPKGALAADTEISMIPVKSMEGLPFKNGMVGSVQFEPDGLFLYEDAFLTIEPAQAVPVENQILFGYRGTGQDVHLEIPGPDKQKIQIRVPHFSGVGLGSGMATDRAALLLSRAADHEVRIRQQAADYITKQRESGADDLSGITDLFQSYYGLVVRPRMLAASSSCENGKLAIQTVLGFERERQLLGSAEDSSNAIKDLDALMDTIYAKCREEKIKECKMNKSPEVLIQFELGYERQRQLLGHSPIESIEDLLKEAIKICGMQTYHVIDTPGAPGSWSGACIDDLSKPFSVKFTTVGTTMSFNLSPSSSTAGSLVENMKVEMGAVSMDYQGNGSYTIIPTDKDPDGNVIGMEILYSTTGTSKSCSEGKCVTNKMDSGNLQIPLRVQDEACP
jgi:hypothetical protein